MGGNLPLFLALTAVMGLSILISLPVVLSRRAQGRWGVGLNAAAIGILLFLLADIFSNVAPILYPQGYVASASYSATFAFAFLIGFVGLFAIDNLRPAGPSTGPTGPDAVPHPVRTASIIAIGIGLQNLTEGLVFGVNWTAGTVGILAVVFLGFLLQNISEGFPIAAPFLGSSAPRELPTLVALFLAGGLPTILGGAIGYFWSSDQFLVIFDALAIGAIVYVILPLLKVAFRPLESREASVARNRIVYLGVMAGFVIGFAANAL